MFRGHNFREDYRKLETLSSLFLTAKIVAMTATATKEYQTGKHYEKSEHERSKLVIANPDKPNIFYEVQQRPSYLKESNNQFEEILSPIVDELIIAHVKTPVTIIYSSLEICGVGLNLPVWRESLGITSSTLLGLPKFLKTGFLLNFTCHSR